MPIPKSEKVRRCKTRHIGPPTETTALEPCATCGASVIVATHTYRDIIGPDDKPYAQKRVVHTVDLGVDPTGARLHIGVFDWTREPHCLDCLLNMIKNCRP